MKLIARHCYLFLLLIIPFLSTAQSNFRPGTVQLIDGTTISGYVRINNWENTPNRIAFKLGREKATNFYSPQEISSFEVEGYQYTSALVEVETSPSSLNLLEDNPTLNIAQKHIFIQHILEKDHLNHTMPY